MGGESKREREGGFTCSEELKNKYTSNFWNIKVEYKLDQVKMEHWKSGEKEKGKSNQMEHAWIQTWKLKRKSEDGTLKIKWKRTTCMF